MDPLEQLKDFTRPEAPPAIYSINIDDTDAEFFLQGSWKTGIGGYLGFDSKGQVGANVSVPGFTQTPWYNSVDFLASIWIKRQFFFETQLSDGFKFNTFSLGYANPAVPGLNKVQIANTGIAVPDFSWLGIGGAVDQAPGLLSEWSTDKSRHYAMLRLVNRSTVTQEFRGTTPVLSQKTRPDAFLRGQFFQLPYQGVTEIQVWLESSGGVSGSDGRKYLLASARDFLYVDPGSGRFGLKKAAGGRLLASFVKGTSALPVQVPALDGGGVISASDVLDFDSGYLAQRVLKPLHDEFQVGNGNSLDGADGLQVTVGGTRAWLLHDPGRFSLFEDCSWYAKPQNINPKSLSLDSGNDPDLTVSVLDEVVHLARAGADGVAVRYPLLASKHVDRSRLYLPGYQAAEDRFLVWRGDGTNNGLIILDNEPVVSSIVVQRNGRTTVGFSWDDKRKALLFTDPLRDDEIILVTYDLKSGSGPRTVQFIQANRFDFLPWLSASLGVAADWPLDTSATGVESNAQVKVGRIMAGADVRAAPPDTGLVVSSSLSGRLDVPGATGPTTLQAYDGQTLSVPPATNALLPSNPASWLAGKGLDSSTRGKLLFRDYRSSTGEYLAYDSTAPASAAYATGQATGPYIAKSSANDPFSELLTIGEFNLATADQWVAWEIRLTAAQRAALANSGSLGWWMKATGLEGGGIDVWVEAGALAEDIDGTGNMASARSGEYGLAFRDSVRNLDLVAASTYQNTSAILLSKDANANGLLDAESNGIRAGIVAGRTATLGLSDSILPVASFPAGSSDWSEVRLSLGRQDRIRLQSATALRIIVRKQSSAANITGRLLWGNIRIDLPGMQADPSGGMIAKVSTGTRLDLHKELASAFPVAVTQDAPPAYAVLDWNGSSGDSALFTQVLDPVGLARFGVFRFFLRGESLPGAGSSNIRLELADTAGSYTCSPFDPGLIESKRWYQAEFDLKTSRFRLTDSTGKVLVENGCQISGSPQAIRSLRIRVVGLGANAGSFMVDSIQVDQGVPHIAASLGLGLDWSNSAAVLSVGTFPLVSGLRIHQSVQGLTDAETADHAGLANEASTRLNWDGLVGAALVGVDIEVGAHIGVDAGGYGGQFTYRLGAPVGFSFPLFLKDSFTGSSGKTELQIAKSSSANLNAGFLGTLGASATVAYNADNLQQQWGAVLDLLPGQAFWWKTKAELAQNAKPELPGGFGTSSSLTEQLAQGFTWYMPIQDTLTTRRTTEIGNSFGLQIAPVRLTFNQNLQTLAAASEAYRYATRLGLGAGIVLGEPERDGGFSLDYSREVRIAENWRGSDGLIDLGHAFDDWGKMPAAWAVWPVWELFDPAPAFGVESQSWPAASVKPMIRLSLARTLDPAWWAMLLPKQLKGGLARALTRTGNNLVDDFVVYAGSNWLVLNQFGRLGASPVFTGYETDQLELGFSTGTRFREQVRSASQVQLDLTIRLFGLESLPGLRLASKSSGVRKTDGVLELMEPDQLALSTGWYYRDGNSSLNAFRIGVDFSWAADVAGLENGFFNRRPSSPVFLENVESLNADIGSGITGTDNASSALDDLYGLQPTGSYNSRGGGGLVFRHKSYLILPGMAYVGVFLGYGFDVAQASGLTVHAVQAGIEARLRF